MKMNEVQLENLNGSNVLPEGIGGFVKRAEQGDALTVVFFGGSLTWGANASDPNRTSYRARIMEKLRTQYPHARWRFVDAAIGGTGSTLGVYRLERDVLAYNPDLVFLDFTLNDNAKMTDDAALSAYEAIIRRILNHDSLVFPVFLASRDYVTLEDVNELKRRTSHLSMFKKYNLSCADVIAAMRADFQSGKLDLDKVWPPELFDMTHPHDFGYSVYAEHVWSAFLNAAAENRKPVLPEQRFSTSTYAHVQRFKLSTLPELPKGWQTGYPEIRSGTFDFLCSRWQDNEVIAANCSRHGFSEFEMNDCAPAPLTVQFYGTTVSIFGEATIWSGPYKIMLDGELLNTYNDLGWAQIFSPSAYLIKVLAKDLAPDQLHSLTIQPEFSITEPQMLKLESICVAGPERAEVIA